MCRNDFDQIYHKRLFAKACPEPDLRYRSKDSAFARIEKAM